MAQSKSGFRSILKRGNLLAGLLLIVVVAVGPAIAVLVDLQHHLRRDRDVNARNVAVQRAELLSVSLGNIVEGARQMMVALTVTDRLKNLRPACGDLLDDLRSGAPDYLVFAVADSGGALVCSSAAARLPPEAAVAFTKPFLPASAFTVGGYTVLPGLGRPVLSFALPFTASDGRRAVLVAGLDLARIAAVLGRLHQPVDSRVAVADRNGTVLARAPARPDAVGGALGRSQAFLHATAAGSAIFEVDGEPPRVVGYVPPGPESAGLFVTAGFSIEEIVGGIDTAVNRGYVLTMLGAACSILLALVVGQRYLRAPASVLLQAARRWGSGDLDARADMPPRSAGEFAGLGVAFNRMAELLQQQRTELQGLNDALEQRVAERTRALLESNNRLQVEIAERELTEANLRQAQKLQAVGQLAGGVAHDFNNLLTAILGSLELLGKRLGSPDARARRLLDTATQAVARGSRLTAQLLAFSRKQPVLAVSVDVASALEGIAGLLASTLGGKIALETRIEPGLWPAMLDPNQFEAAILNIALNARDSMPAGGRLIITAANITTTPHSPATELPPGDYVAVTLTDTGSGMSAEIANRAFEPFFTTKPPGEGSGLGLSQVHGMARQSGGSVTIHSRPGNGTKVQVFLPRSAADPLRMDGVDYSTPALGRSETVLLVDDDEQVRIVTEAVLADAGYTVITAADGKAALDALGAAGQRIGLVIADYAMPGMTGLELLQAVRRDWPGIAVLLATGYADYPELISGDLPMDQIVRKPFRSNELLARIHAAAERTRTAEPQAAGD